MNIKNILCFLIIGLVMVFLNLIVHETGHVFTSNHYGAKIVSVEILGWEMYPDFEFQGFQKYLGKVSYSGSFIPTQNGIIALMGSGATWIMSIFFLLVLYGARNQLYTRFKTQTVLLFGSLMFLDFVTYSFGLRFTGVNEPMRAANYLHVPWGPMLAAVVVLGAIQFLLVLRYIAISGYWKFFFKETANYQS